MSRLTTRTVVCGKRHVRAGSALRGIGMKTVRIFSDRIRDRIRLERFRSVRIRVRIFNIRYRIRIRIFKSYIYDVDIQLYLIRHDWHYPYSDLNSTTNMKTNIISVISVRIRSVFIPTWHCGRKQRWRFFAKKKSSGDVCTCLWSLARCCQNIWSLSLSITVCLCVNDNSVPTTTTTEHRALRDGDCCVPTPAVLLWPLTCLWWGFLLGLV